MDTPAEIDDHQFPEVFNMQRVKPLLAEKAMIQHNIALSLQAALELKKAAVANIKTKKHKRAEIDSLPETQMIKTFTSEKLVVEQLNDFVTDQRDQAVSMHVVSVI